VFISCFATFLHDIEGSTSTPKCPNELSSASFEIGLRYEAEINLKCWMAVFTIWIISCGQTV